MLANKLHICLIGGVGDMVRSRVIGGISIAVSSGQGCGAIGPYARSADSFHLMAEKPIACFAKRKKLS